MDAGTRANAPAATPFRRLGMLAAGLLLLGGAIYGWHAAGAAGPAADRLAEVLAEDICIVRPGAPFPGAVHPYDPASGLQMLAARPVPALARCAVCGMYPARHPQWAAQVIVASGDAWFFDSPVDMLLFIADSNRFTNGQGAGEIAARYVTDYAGGGWVPAAQAWFVHGSTAKGPMRGPDLPAFAKRKDAETFARARGGEVFAFDALDVQIAELLRYGHGHHGHSMPAPAAGEAG